MIRLYRESFPGVHESEAGSKRGPRVSPDESNEKERNPTKPHYKLYAVRAVVLSTVIGTPLAGGTLMALNYTEVGNPVRAVGPVLIGLGITVSFIGFALSTSPDNPMLGLIYWFVLPPIMYVAVRLLQGRFLKAHGFAGGEYESEWKAAGIAVVVLAAVLACVFFIQEYVIRS